MSESVVKIRGWTFERLDTGMVQVEKERLIADSILLDEGEWEEIVAGLWTPGQSIEGGDEEWGDDEPE